MLRRVMVVAAAALAAAAPVSAAAAASAPRAAPVPSAPGAAPRTGAATVLSDVGGTFCEQFYCANREECTSWDKVNDGYSDCSDGSDENCYGSNCCAVINAATKRSASASVVADVDGGIVTVLTPGFRCGDGSCIDSSLVNNGYTDCRDASDEPSVCPSYEFDCRDGSQCIPYDKVNDGYTDCATGADEPCNGLDCCSYLPHSEASPEEAVRGFRCNDGQCVDRNAFNNGYTECADGSDENNGGGDGDGGDGGSPTDGWSSGDPHLTTLDGLYYDFQALGFFQLCASADVTIHTCQQPWVLFPQAVAVNHAVAVGRAGEGVFQVSFNTAAGTFETRINGSPVTLGNGQSAAVGTAGTVTRSFETYVYTGSGGDLVRLETSDWAQWVNVQYHPRSRPAATSGLCGTADGNSANDFTARDGTVYSPFSTEYAGTQSGLTWRVPEGDLLLSGVTCPSELPDYAPYYLSANNFRLAVGKKPAAQKRAAPSAQQAFDMDAFVAEHLAEARACLTEEERNIVDFGVDGSPEQTLVLQKLLDLIVIHNPTNGTATVGPCETDKRVAQQAYFSSPSCFNVNYCGGHGRCASNGQSCVCDAGWAGADCSVPVSDEFVGLCNGAGQGSCASAVIQTSGGTATIRWGPDGTCQ